MSTLTLAPPYAAPLDLSLPPSAFGPRLADPGLDARHPRQAAHRALTRGHSTTWWADGDAVDVVEHLLPLLGITRCDLVPTRTGSATTRDRTTLLIGMAVGRWASVSVVGAGGPSGLAARALHEEAERWAGRARPTVTAQMHRGVVLDVSAGTAERFAAYLDSADAVALDDV